GYSLTGYAPQTYVWFVLLAIIPQLIGHTVLNWALGYLPATFVSVALLGEPVGTVILSYLFLREAPTFLELAGGILILTGIYISSRMDAGKME
ncbi:MAG TPA: DMT family transporter, partial [Anaerolineaceae bacterium]|nr:DMT family transporter [Anaerolineaceae bacterium]